MQVVQSSAKTERPGNVLLIRASGSQHAIIPNGQCASGIAFVSLAPELPALNMAALMASRNAMSVVLGTGHAVNVAKK